MRMKTRGLLTAELFKPAKEHLIEGGFHIEKLDTHADTAFDSAHDGERFHYLLFTRVSEAGAAAETERRAGAYKSTADGKVGSYATGRGTGLEIQELGVGRKRVANGVAPVANGNGAPRAY